MKIAEVAYARDQIPSLLNDIETRLRNYHQVMAQARHRHLMYDAQAEEASRSIRSMLQAVSAMRDNTANGEPPDEGLWKWYLDSLPEVDRTIKWIKSIAPEKSVSKTSHQFMQALMNLFHGVNTICFRISKGDTSDHGRMNDIVATLGRANQFLVNDHPMMAFGLMLKAYYLHVRRHKRLL